MQRLQFSISWLQTTKVSFTSVLVTEVEVTSVLETEVKIFLHPPPPTPSFPLHFSNALIINFWKNFQPPDYSKTPDYSVLWSKYIKIYLGSLYYSSKTPKKQYKELK